MAEDGTRRRRRRPRRRPGSGGRGGDSPGAANGSEGRGEAGGRSGGERRHAGGRGGGRGGGGSGDRRRQRGRGGRARSARGARGRPRRQRFGEHWWARRWIEVLEGFQVGRRLGRGRSYARQGQVIDLDLGKGFVTAKVQGSRDAPYLVRMRLSMLSSTDWKKVTRALADEPEVSGRLLVGEIPEEIEETFARLDLSLFPTASGDLKAACSCPDRANPCKHVAAVYYLLGEEFDRDPFLIFQLRGIERSELLSAIGGAAAAKGVLIPPPPRPPMPEPPEARAEPEEEPEDREERPEDEAEDAGALAERVERTPPPAPAEPEPEPLPLDAHDFWAGHGGTRDPGREVRVPTLPAALPKRLGGFPFWRGESDCEAAMVRIYRNASIAGLDVYLGEMESHEE
jgi:uncharacterized Zn finger protein